jgi:hypothetical protein
MTRIELRCARDLALRLGATMPETTAHHRQFRDQDDLLVRDPRQAYVATFWPWALSAQEMAGARLTPK